HAVLVESPLHAMPEIAADGRADRFAQQAERTDPARHYVFGRGRGDIGPYAAPVLLDQRLAIQVLVPFERQRGTLPEIEVVVVPERQPPIQAQQLISPLALNYVLGLAVAIFGELVQRPELVGAAKRRPGLGEIGGKQSLNAAQAVRRPKPGP